MVSRKLLERVKLHEGWRNKAYQDTEGVWTVGYGRNLQELVITQETGEKWLRQDLEEAKTAANRFPEYGMLDTTTRKEVFVEMIFNMGPSRVAGFKNMLAAIRQKQWDIAAKEMLDSKWARQVGNRALTLATLMEVGCEKAVDDPDANCFGDCECESD